MLEMVDLCVLFLALPIFYRRGSGHGSGLNHLAGWQVCLVVPVIAVCTIWRTLQIRWQRPHQEHPVVPSTLYSVGRCVAVWLMKNQLLANMACSSTLNLTFAMLWGFPVAPFFALAFPNRQLLICSLTSAAQFLTGFTYGHLKSLLYMTPASTFVLCVTMVSMDVLLSMSLVTRWKKRTVRSPHLPNLPVGDSAATSCVTTSDSPVQRIYEPLVNDNPAGIVRPNYAAAAALANVRPSSSTTEHYPHTPVMHAVTVQVDVSPAAHSAVMDALNKRALPHVCSILCAKLGPCSCSSFCASYRSAVQMVIWLRCVPMGQLQPPMAPATLAAVCGPALVLLVMQALDGIIARPLLLELRAGNLLYTAQLTASADGEGVAGSSPTDSRSPQPPSWRLQSLEQPEASTNVLLDCTMLLPVCVTEHQPCSTTLRVAPAVASAVLEEARVMVLGEKQALLAYGEVEWLCKHTIRCQLPSMDAGLKHLLLLVSASSQGRPPSTLHALVPVLCLPSEAVADMHCVWSALGRVSLPNGACASPSNSLSRSPKHTPGPRGLPSTPPLLTPAYHLCHGFMADVACLFAGRHHLHTGLQVSPPDAGTGSAAAPYLALFAKLLQYLHQNGHSRLAYSLSSHLLGINANGTSGLQQCTTCGPASQLSQAAVCTESQATEQASTSMAVPDRTAARLDTNATLHMPPAGAAASPGMAGPHVTQPPPQLTPCRMFSGVPEARTGVHPPQPQPEPSRVPFATSKVDTASAVHTTALPAVANDPKSTARAAALTATANTDTSTASGKLRQKDAEQDQGADDAVCPACGEACCKPQHCMSASAKRAQREALAQAQHDAQHMVAWHAAIWGIHSTPLAAAEQALRSRLCSVVLDAWSAVSHLSIMARSMGGGEVQEQPLDFVVSGVRTAAWVVAMVLQLLGAAQGAAHFRARRSVLLTTELIVVLIVVGVAHFPQQLCDSCRPQMHSMSVMLLDVLLLQVPARDLVWASTAQVLLHGLHLQRLRASSVREVLWQACLYGTRIAAMFVRDTYVAQTVLDQTRQGQLSL